MKETIVMHLKKHGKQINFVFSLLLRYSTYGVIDKFLNCSQKQFRSIFNSFHYVFRNGFIERLRWQVGSKPFQSLHEFGKPKVLNMCPIPLFKFSLYGSKCFMLIDSAKIPYPSIFDSSIKIRQSGKSQIEFLCHIVIKFK